MKYSVRLDRKNISNPLNEEFCQGKQFLSCIVCRTDLSSHGYCISLSVCNV